MPLEFIAALAVAAFGVLVFGRFENRSPPTRRIVRWGVYLGLVVLFTLTLGRPWSLVFTFGLVAPGIAFHFAWCLAHGINPFTSEPRAKHLALRGWTSEVQPK